jgi:hypothetical protein
MQEYFLKLIGNYRRYIHDDTPMMNAMYEAQQQQQQQQALPSPRSSPSSASASASPGGEPRRREREGSEHAGRGGDQREDNALKGYGQVFQHGAFVAQHRWVRGCKAVHLCGTDGAARVRGVMCLTAFSQVYQHSTFVAQARERNEGLRTFLARMVQRE